MNYLQKREIKAAVLSGDGAALEEAINQTPKHSRDFKDVIRFIKRLKASNVKSFCSQSERNGRND